MRSMHRRKTPGGRARGASALGALALVAATATSARAEEKPTFGSWPPPSRMVNEQGLKPFFERVEKDGGGKATRVPFPGGAMGGPKEARQIVREGPVDGARVVDLCPKSEFPTAMARSRLFMLVDGRTVQAMALPATQPLDCARCRDELQGKLEIAPLASCTGGDQHLTWIRDIHVLAGIEGKKKARSSTRGGAPALHWEAVPVGLSIAELCDRLRRGQADCTIGAYGRLTSCGTRDAATSILEDPIGGCFAAPAPFMTNERRDALEAGTKAVRPKKIPRLVAGIDVSSVGEGLAAREEAMATGIRIRKTSPDMRAGCDAFPANKRVFAREASRGDGAKNPEELAGVLMTGVEKQRGIRAGIGSDRDPCAEALRREVHSRL